MKNELIEKCKEYIIEGNKFVIAEPYIPYIPENWNGILILAESQNLSKTNDNYVTILRSLTPEQRIERLYYEESYIGVYPWDDGSLKLAVESALNIKVNDTAVSNAVLWSQRNETGANKNPSDEIIKLSSLLWKDFLEIINPTMIVSAGNIARDIILKTNWKGKQINLRLPSKMALSRVSGMFDKADLLKRYPEVKLVINKNKNWVKSYELNKIFYACHAISIIYKLKKPNL
ncbi:MAG: hypothetical protein U1C46_09955 [Bacteroidales bacterium]|nr:hypothetical protein [Bacteroidales bacterium]